MQTKEEFSGFLENLKKASEQKTVVVEGIKDKKALVSLGIKNIMTLKKTPLCSHRRHSSKQRTMHNPHRFG